MKKYNLNFHQTFCPDKNYISKLLSKTSELKLVTKEQISEITTIPTGNSSGKVEPTIEYMKYMDLIDYKKESNLYTIRKTPLGELVSREDEYLSERITLLMLNYFLTSKSFGAEMWYKILREMPYKYGRNISMNIVMKEMESYYKKKVKMGALNSTYINEYSFNEINIVDIDKENYSFKSIKYNYEEIYMYAYTLIKELEYLDSERKEFTINEIVDDLKWNLGFGWTKDEAYNVLEQLENKGIVKINKQLNPITVIVNKENKEIINDIYSLLF